MRNILILFSCLLIGIGLTFIVINLNVLAIDNNIWQVLKDIFLKLECNIFFVGILLLVIILKRRKNYDRL